MPNTVDTEPEDCYRKTFAVPVEKTYEEVEADNDDYDDWAQ